MQTLKDILIIAGLLGWPVVLFTVVALCCDINARSKE